LLLGAGFLSGLAAARAAETAPDPNAGLVVTFTVPGAASGKNTDARISPNVQLYVPAGQPPTPFVPAGPFEAVWTGALVMDLRGEYGFRAELNGKIKIEVNGQTALESSESGGSTPPTKALKFNKGKNLLKITFASPEKGDAFVRLYWAEKPDRPTSFDLVPDAQFAHDTDTPELTQGRDLRLGRELTLEHRCFKCHAPALAVAGVPELGMDAPAFDGIGSRRRADWIAEWVADPRAIRPAARMPKLLHGPKAKDQAVAIAAYLGSLSGPAPAAAPALAPEQTEAGEKLFTTLNCAGCHLPPDSTDSDPTKIPLKRVGQKFAPGALVDLLQKPEAHYAWIRMPNFKFKPEEAANLAAYLLSLAEKPADSSAKAPGDLVAEGKKLVQTSGCLNCHALKEENKFAPPAMAALKDWTAGCLADAAKDDSPAPQFALSAPERAAIQAFAKSPVFADSLQTDVPTEFAERQTRLMNCRACHGQIEGFPALDLLGGKLRPEWMASFIGGEITYKPRHWLPARMPAFKSRAAEIAIGLVMSRGAAPVSPAEPPIDNDLAAVGRKLISVNGGFSCVLCHAVNKTPATQVFESEGVNLGYSAARIQRAYYYRWVRNPQSIDPQTKMPRFFSEDDKSPLDILGADAQKQLDAIWNYLRQGPKMQPPPGPDGQ
jgi:mono/diheme cytochrome c family protein